jgi:hypothetical protein
MTSERDFSLTSERTQSENASESRVIRIHLSTCPAPGFDGSATMESFGWTL